ncbi:MAG: class I SAM-dependent methyltransferase, partial [Lysobacter sp.]|nr:class I SAM-dependent methyltransferase [Lysobacter sp.]
MSAYIYQPAERAESYESAVIVLGQQGRRVVQAGVDNTSPARVQAILDKAVEAGLPFTRSRIDVAAYREYFERAGYATRYRDYYTGNQPEKSLEHFLTMKLLDVGPSDVFVDLASEHSPVPDIYRALTGCKAYRQDIMYPAGVNGDRIGGDAAAMPVPDGFFTKAALTCSLEHFEGNADSKLFVELARTLRPGGRVCVAPYYVYE